jgi:hypothetical protein
MFRRISLLLVIAYALVSPVRANCLKYEPEKVTLAGVISERVDFGPPGYGEDPKHDSKEPHLYLKLDKTVCLSAKPGDDLNGGEYGVKQMQMVYFIHLKFRKAWLGKHVSVTGTLFHGITGHHHTAVLITPSGTHVLPAARR